MVRIFGKEYSRKELLRRVGDIYQIGGVKFMQYTDGPEKGVRAIEIRTGTGFRFIVLPDRGLDISHAEYNGIPLNWRSPTGDVAPEFYDPRGLEWLRGFFGGLLVTCGLTQVGVPTVDNGEELGLHGRYSYIPARNVYADGYWEGDEYYIVVRGKVREARVFGPNIVLEREISTKISERRLFIKDRVINEGWDSHPLMILYHFNIGWPVVDEGAKLVLTSKAYVPRDKDAWVEPEKYDTFTEPTKGFKERVYFHLMTGDEQGYAYAGILNWNLEMGVYAKFKVSQLNRMIEWKMMGEGLYVVGIEPSNCFVLGRRKERELGTLEFLKPGEDKILEIEFGVLLGNELKEFEDTVNRVTGGRRPDLVKTLDEFVNLLKGS